MIKALGIVTFNVFPAHMGGQKGVALFYKYLAKYLEITLAVTRENDTKDAQVNGVTAFPIVFPNRSIYANLSHLVRLATFVKKKDIQIIIAEHSYPAFIGFWLKQRTGKPFIIHSHNIEALRFKQMGRPWWKAYLKYERWIHRKADFNFFISEEDRTFALKEFGLQPQKCAVITYGIEQRRVPAQDDKSDLKRQLGFPEGELIFLFNGTLDYVPNVAAIKELIDQLLPQLERKLTSFKIVVTGNRAKPPLIQTMEQCPHILFRGFVKNIDAYYQAADLFVNPITNDSGVKTKVIEALANNCTVISFKGGATGIPLELCGEKLHTVPNGDYTALAQKVMATTNNAQANTPQAFYESYNWDNIAQKAAQHIKSIVQQHG